MRQRGQRRRRRWRRDAGGTWYAGIGETKEVKETKKTEMQETEETGEIEETVETVALRRESLNVTGRGFLTDPPLHWKTAGDRG